MYPCHIACASPPGATPTSPAFWCTRNRTRALVRSTGPPVFAQLLAYSLAFGALACSDDAGEGNADVGHTPDDGRAVADQGPDSAPAADMAPPDMPPDDPRRFLRLAHLANTNAADACIATSAEGPFTGPLLAAAGEAALAAGEVDSHREVAPQATTLTLRWVDASASDCSTPLAGTDEVAVELETTRRATVALHGPDTALTSLVYASDIATTLAARRFYVRFANLAPTLDPVSIKQVTCETPFGAFENAGYGALAFSPNDMDDYFSASVSLGLDSFTTTPVVCDGTTEILRTPEYEFRGGVSVSFFIFEDAMDRLRITACADTTTPPVRCTPFPPMDSP